MVANDKTRRTGNAKQKYRKKFRAYDRAKSIHIMYISVRSADDHNPKKVETDAHAFLRTIPIGSITHPRTRPVGNFLLKRGQQLVQAWEIGVHIETSTATIQYGNCSSNLADVTTYNCKLYLSARLVDSCVAVQKQRRSFRFQPVGGTSLMDFWRVSWQRLWQM